MKGKIGTRTHLKSGDIGLGIYVRRDVHGNYTPVWLLQKQRKVTKDC